jgi:hypothetical protein
MTVLFPLKLIFPVWFQNKDQLLRLLLRHYTMDTISCLTGNRNNEHHSTIEWTYFSHLCKWIRWDTVSFHMLWAWMSHSAHPCTHQYSCTQTCPIHWCRSHHAGKGWTYTHQYQHHIYFKEKHTLHSLKYNCVLQKTLCMSYYLNNFVLFNTTGLGRNAV